MEVSEDEVKYGKGPNKKWMCEEKKYSVTNSIGPCFLIFMWSSTETSMISFH